MTEIVVPLPVADLSVLRQRRSAKWQIPGGPIDSIPLPVAEMDFELAAPIKRVLAEAVERSDTGYSAPNVGVDTAFAGFAKRRWDWEVRIDADCAPYPVADVGVGHVELLRLIGQPGDNVVVSTPIYAPYFHWIEETNRTCVEVKLCNDASGWSLDLDGIEAAFAAGASAYLLCNPHNPTGFVPTVGQLQALVDLAVKYGVRILSDEIHGPLIYLGATFTPLLAIPGASEVTLSLVSASKAWNLAGLKCALIVPGSPTMQAIVDRLPADIRWRVGHFGTMAAVTAFDEGEPWLDALVATLEMRRDQLGLLIDDLPGVSWQAPDSTYLAWLNCRESGLADPHQAFAAQGVWLEPGAKFGTPGEGFVRLNFATSPEILAEAGDRMRRALS